jgi:hypothetical protein
MGKGRREEGKERGREGGSRKREARRSLSSACFGKEGVGRETRDERREMREAPRSLHQKSRPL